MNRGLSDDALVLIQKWTSLIGASPFDAIAPTMETKKILNEFHQWSKATLSERLVQNKRIYRGIGVTGAAIKRLLKGGHVKFKKRIAESWTFDLGVAHGFSSRAQKKAGVVIQLPKIKMNTMILNLASQKNIDEIVRMHEDADLYPPLIKAAMNVEFELLLASQTTLATLKNILIIRLHRPKSLIEEILEIVQKEDYELIPLDKGYSGISYFRAEGPFDMIILDKRIYLGHSGNTTNGLFKDIPGNWPINTDSIFS